jgi:uncharacterized protein YbjT (DUF2867 family)
MFKVLIAGSTGYLGKYAVAAFKKHGYYIRALARNPDKLKREGHFLEPAVYDLVDEVYEADISNPPSLALVCRNVDIVFSSLGITRQKDKVTFRDVDYCGNHLLLELAKQSLVKKFIFVSVFNADKLIKETPMVYWREKIVDELVQSGLDYTVIRPNGFFSDLSEFLKMAQSGRVYLVGKGNNKINPIHGEDLAEICVKAVNSGEKEIKVGGPETFTQQEIAALAFDILHKNKKISTIPYGLGKTVAALVKPFSEKYYSLIKFFLQASQLDFIAPPYGEHYLKDYYQQLVDRAAL